MKKFLVIFGSFVLFVLCWGTLFKLLHWPGAGPMLVIGISLFTFIFLPLFFIHRMVEKRTGLSIITNIFALLSTFLIFTGVMFKVMHWPGAAIMLLLGTFTFIFPTLILYIVVQFKENGRKFGEFWRTVVLAIMASVFFMWWGTSPAVNILQGFLTIEDATLKTNKSLEEINLFILTEINAGADSSGVNKQTAIDIRGKSLEMKTYIQEIKNELIMYVERDPNALDNHWNINSLDNYDIPTHFLSGEQGKGRELYEKLNLFNKELEEKMKAFLTEDQLLQNKRKFIVNTDLRPQLLHGLDSWEDGLFYHQVLIGSLAILSSLETEVLNAEFYCLKTIKAKNQ